MAPFDARSSAQAPSVRGLPARLTSFVGRQTELAEIGRLLATSRLVMLIGAPGVGKTRLALQVAAERGERFAAGAWLVELAGLVEPDLVPGTVASAIGIVEQADRPTTVTLSEYVGARSLLLVLDNCEHLVAACAVLAETLLRACPNLRILATSREALRIDGETTWRVPSLATPEPPQHAPPEARSTDDLLRSEAVRLFVDRAQAVRPSFTLDDRNAKAVAQICRRLDGIPLAIELAAARLDGLSANQIATYLDDRFSLLSSGSRTALPRQQTLRGALDWSYALLAEPERVLLRRLAVFAGGWTLEAAERVASVEGRGTRDEGGFRALVPCPSPLDTLLALVSRSLVQAEERDGETRYRLLEMVRQYGWEKLAEAGELDDLRDRHADWLLALAEQAEPHLMLADSGPWLRRLQAEHDNFRAALRWCLADQGDFDTGARMAASLSRFWHVRSYLIEGQHWLDLALASTDEGLAASRAMAMTRAGWLLHNRGYTSRAGALFGEAADLYRQLGDRHGLALAVGDLGIILEYQGNHEQAAALLSESLALYEKTGDRLGVTDRLRDLGSVACAQGDFDRAIPLLEENLRFCRQFGGTFRIALALGSLGLAPVYQGDAERALELLEECLTLHRQTEHTYGIAWSLHYLGRVALLRGDTVGAAALLLESLEMRQQLGDRGGITQCLEGMAAVGLARGHGELAVRLFGAATSLRGEIDVLLTPAERAAFMPQLEAERARLTVAGHATVWEEGRSWSLDRAIAEARELAQSVTDDRLAPAHRKGADRTSPLSPREREVAMLVAHGLQNAQIAAELVISRRTADTHLRNILGKLGLTSRAQLAAWAVREGMADTPPN